MTAEVKPVTHTVIILDQSGSMEGTKSESIKGFNEKVQQAQIAHNSGEQDVFVSLITFNGDVYEHLWCQPATEILEATEEDFRCGGSTALRDALGYAIEKLLATTDHKNPNVSYFLEIISDGKENASQHFKQLEKLQNLVDRVEQTKRWTITYMGCDIKYVQQVADELKIPRSNCAMWLNDTVGSISVGFSNSNKASARYYKARSVGTKSLKTVHCSAEGLIGDYTVPTESDLTDTLEVKDDLVHCNKIAKQGNYRNKCNVNKIKLSEASPFMNSTPVNWANLDLG